MRIDATNTGKVTLLGSVLIVGIFLGLVIRGNTSVPSWKKLRSEGESISASAEALLHRARDYATLVEARARDEGEERRVTDDCKRLKARTGDAYAAATCIIREIDEIIEEEERAAEKAKSK